MTTLEKSLWVLLLVLLIGPAMLPSIYPLPDPDLVYGNYDTNKPMFHFKVRVLAANPGPFYLSIADTNKSQTSTSKKVKLKKCFIGEMDSSIGHAWSSDSIPAWSLDDVKVEGFCQDQPVRIVVYINGNFHDQLDRHTGRYFRYGSGDFSEMRGNLLPNGERDTTRERPYRVFNN